MSPIIPNQQVVSARWDSQVNQTCLRNPMVRIRRESHLSRMWGPNLPTKCRAGARESASWYKADRSSSTSSMRSRTLVAWRSNQSKLGIRDNQRDPLLQSSLMMKAISWKRDKRTKLLLLALKLYNLWTIIQRSKFRTRWHQHFSKWGSITTKYHRVKSSTRRLSKAWTNCPLILQLRIKNKPWNIKIWDQQRSEPSLKWRAASNRTKRAP